MLPEFCGETHGKFCVRQSFHRPLLCALSLSSYPLVCILLRRKINSHHVSVDRRSTVSMFCISGWRIFWYEKTSSEASVFEFCAFVSLLYLTSEYKTSPWARFRRCWKVGGSLGFLDLCPLLLARWWSFFQIFYILATAHNNKNACLSGLVSWFPWFCPHVGWRLRYLLVF